MNVWLSDAELQAIPASGPAWDALKRTADSSFPLANLASRNTHNVQVLAAAIVGARLDSDVYRIKVTEELRKIITTPVDSLDLLGACRNLGTYAIALDLIGVDKTHYRSWFRDQLRWPYEGGGGGGSIIEIHESRPNNWGTHAAGSRIAVDLVFDDQIDLARAILVHKGFLGDRTAYTFPDREFQNRRDWHPNLTRMVPINPAGALVQGRNVDGMFPNEMGRTAFVWPPPTTGDAIQYSWGCVEGLTVATTLLRRAGYDAHLWSDKACLRALQSLYLVCGVKAEGDDVFELDIYGYLYGDEARFATQGQLPLTDSRAHALGKNMAGTSYTHRGRVFGSVTPEPPDDCEALRVELAAVKASNAVLVKEIETLTIQNVELHGRIGRAQAALAE